MGSISSARVNPFNQTGSQIRARDAEWSLPLISLPGRAGLDLGLSLSYSSLVWTKSGPYLYFDEDISQISPGFHLGFAAIQGPTFDPVTSRKVFVLVSSAGSRVELRQVNSSSIYEAGDSSYLQLTDNGNDTLTLRTTDGTQISYSHYASDWQATQIKDRNGNYISIGNDWRGDINTITDTLGRVIYLNNDGNGNLSSITQYWNGGWHTWANFSWGSALSMDTSSLTGVVGTYYGEQIPVVRGVSLADGSFYGFDYRGNGQVSVIRRYSNDSVQRSYVAYDYENPSDDCPRIYQARVWADAWVGSEVVTQFNLPGDGSHQMVTPDQTVYREYYGSGWQNGLVTDARVYASGLQRQTTAAYTQDNTGVNYQTNPRVVETNVYDAVGNRRRTTIEYHSSFGLPHYIVEYAADGYNFLRRTHLEYKFDSQYIDRRIIGLLYQREVYDNSWTMMARTQYQYDWGGEFMQDLPAAPTQHDGGYHTGFISGRGNLAAVDQYDVFDPYNTGKIHEVQTGYDVAGNLRFTRDASGHTASISYGDQFSDYGNGRNTFAYPTTLTDADGFSSYLQYNYDFGDKTLTQSPAPAGQQYGVKQYFYYDNAARLYDTYNESSGARTSFGYGPNYSTTQASINSVYDTYSFRYFDGLGRETVASTYHSSTGTYGTQLTYYDVMGRVSQQSNPTEMYGNWSPSADEAGGWIFSYQTYDWKGRPLVTTNQDGHQKYASYNSCGCAGSEVVTVTDERGRQQRAYADVLGRQYKTEVLNWNGTVYSTTESSLNARDQAYLVRQTDNGTGAYQDTTTSYDGYGRVLTQHAPQQRDQYGNPTYTTWQYNPDNTVLNRTDARGAVTSYGYNGRHQVTSVSQALSGYSTINLGYGYDAAGNRTSMSHSIGGVANDSASYGYDSLSRLTSETRHVNALEPYYPNYGNFSMSYSYNFGGELQNVTDAFSATTTFSYDNVGRTASVTGTYDGGNYTYVSSVGYRAWGAVKSATFGIGSETASYNWRMQPTQYSGAAGSFEYSYYDDGRLQQLHDLNDQVGDPHFVQFHYMSRLYAYDQAGRISSVGTINPQTSQAPPPFTGNYGYDAFNNMNSRSGQYALNPYQSDSATFTNDRRNGWSYNYDGQVTYSTDNSDSGGSSTRNWTYDAAGKLVTVSEVRNGQTATNNLTYDGDGQLIYESLNGSSDYLIYSSVLGTVMNRLSSTGGKDVTYVPTNGLVAPIQYEEPGYGSYLSWIYHDASGLQEGGRARDPFGSLVQNVQPPVGFPPGYTPTYGPPYGYETARGFINSSNFSAGCSLDGMPAPCERVVHYLVNGLANQDANSFLPWTETSGPTNPAGPFRIFDGVRTDTHVGPGDQDDENDVVVTNQEIVYHYEFGGDLFSGAPPQDPRKYGPYINGDPELIPGTGNSPNCWIQVIIQPDTNYQGHSNLPNGPSNMTLNGANYYGLGFVVKGFARGGVGTMATIQGDLPNPQNPNGTWRMEQYTQRYLINEEGKESLDQSMRRDMVQKINMNTSGENISWWDHPSAKYLPASRRQTFLFKLTRGDEHCEAVFHFEQAGKNITWGPGVFP